MPSTKRHRTVEDGLFATPIKGESDLREYKIVHLSNGIEAILVKFPDGQSSKAAVSVSVSAGSMHEPDDFGGLAHFVEHCVFLGNKKYPNRNSLDKLLSKHNGYSNAHTELEYTAYYLEVNKEGLSKATDIFASAFEGPSFDEEMCCAELEAVDSEFHEILNSDDCRVEQMVCVLAEEGHKYRKFTWGNRDSLMKQGGAQLVSEARAFFESHYRPDRIKVSIVSSLSFEKMESLVSLFERIPERNGSEQIALSNLKNCGFPVPVTRLPLTVFVKPIADIHQLTLLFQLPPILTMYRKKPADYIAHLVGHEAEGSLIYALRKANLASDISAGVGSDGYSSNSGVSLFEVKLSLTELGVEKWESISRDYIFPYFDQVAQRGISRATYSELAEIGNFQFNHTTEDCTKEPIDTAEELSVQMLAHWDIAREHLLKQDYLYEDFDEPLILEYIRKHMVAERSITLLVTQRDVQRSTTSEDWVKESIFGISYREEKKHCEEKMAKPEIRQFQIPPLPNLFIPQTGTPLSEHETETIFVTPTEIFEEGGLRMFCFKKTRSQPSLRCDLRVRLNLALDPSIHSFVNTHVLVAYLTDLLEPKLYFPKLAGYSVSISAMPAGKGDGFPAIEVCVNGFQDKLVHVARIIIEKLSRPLEIDQDRLDRVKDALKRGYANEELHPVSSQAVNARKTLLSPLSFFRAEAKSRALLVAPTSSLSQAKINSTRVLLSGSFLESHPAEIKNLILPLLTGGDPQTDPLDLLDIVETINVETRIEEPTINPNEPTSCLVVYYQFSSAFSVEIAVIADVLSDLMSEPFFDSLRTEEQLGYSVQCGSRYTNGSIGVEFSIQSSSESPTVLLERIEKFLERFYKSEIKPMTDSEFDSQIHALVESLVEAPSSLGREAKDLWSEVTENRFMWDFNERIKREITSQFVGKKTKINQLIQNLFINSQNKRIVVGVNGKLSK